MSLSLQVLLLLVVIIAASKLAGSLSHRIGQPAVFGELLVGLILGPTVLGILDWPVFANHHETLAEIVKILAELGVLFLMFLAGLETDLAQMRRVGLAAMGAGVGGVVLPFVGGAYTAHLFGIGWVESIFIGTILTATSVSISAQTLMELGQIHGKEGSTILGAAVIDDVLGILLVSVVVAFTAAGGAATADGIGLLVLRMVLYFAGAIGLGALFLGRLTRWVEDRISASEAVLALAIVVVLLYSWLAEVGGSVATITGAYIAGLLYARTEFGHTIAEKIQSMAYSFFVPIFFISIGLEANARMLGGSPLFAGLIVAVAILSKAVGAAGGAWAARFQPLEALRVGVGMISRGEVGLIVAGIGLSTGVIDRDIFSVMAIMVLVTTMVTPPLLRASFRLETTAALEEMAED